MITFSCPWCAADNVIARHLEGDHNLKSAPNQELLALSNATHQCVSCSRTIHFAIYVEAEPYLKLRRVTYDGETA